MKILVLGGTRYFGRRLVHSLIQEGHEIWVLSRGQQEDDFGARVHRLKGDRKNQESLAQAVGSLSFDLVVDQVCMTPNDAAISCEVFAEKTPYYIMTSTMSVYSLGGNLQEDSYNPFLYQPKKPTNPAEEYGEGKRAAENYFATKAPFKCAFARFPVVVGEDDYTGRLWGHIKKIRDEEPLYFPNLNAKFSFITSEDAARALLWLVHSKHEGAFNFASEDAIPLKELVQDIEAITGKKAHLLQEPSPENWSPYGITEDWFLNVEKAKAAGFKAQPVSQWLHSLLVSLNRV
ncbi:MAG: hypothetical protein OM95_05140 [Bdellovibrio sp. ArHS]|uniref:NAD-dependent epimerase/dehydratase family protein n=1 Tax=Bdellovibrio sp. ArHS TaxID=1569284 RepID=UPI000583E4EB|nr:NAD-dependent epimerase/dehydratase family protein [Bdellovibrio sp. ArHS]KHD89200.1 MAG: hypothetical protein OM95_05140 [Bdellovibrio sp. ArHS]